MTKNIDQKFITYAINLSKKHQGQTSSNPTVGCVITKDDEIIATGVTSKGGAPHGEVNAIDRVSDKSILKGATIYVSLEPCCHSGKTQPCTDQIIKYGFDRVVIAAIDPDKRVNGKSIKLLKDNGIKVVSGVMKKEAMLVNKDFFKSRKTGLPFVTAKIASSMDGKVATNTGHSKWITSSESRYYTNYLRSKYAAILVGANSVKKDNPSLDCRIIGLEDFSPIKIILAKDLDFDKNLKIFNSHKTWIASLNNQSKEFNLINLIKDKNGEIDLMQFLKQIHDQLGINSLLIEGGPNTTTKFIKQNLIDEIIWVRNKKIIGNDGRSAIEDLEVDLVSDAINNFNRVDAIEFNEEIIEIYAIPNPALYLM